MKKLLFLTVLLTVHFISAQNSDKVWDLLLNNKRNEARKLFDKELAKKKDADLDLLILDAILDQEHGKLLYDKTFLEKFSKFNESKDYLYPLWYSPYVMGNLRGDGFNDLSYQKMDVIASNENYLKDPFIKYFKALFERKRKNYDDFNEDIKKLGAIDQWQFCGVFENMNGSGLHTEYEAEYYPKNDKLFNANSNGFVNWYIPSIKQNEGCHFYINESEYGNGIIYAQTFITNDKDREVVLDFTASGPVKIFLNDTEIYVNDKIKTANIGAYCLKFNLKQGNNRLLLKSATTGAGDYFYAAIKDVNKNDIPSLSYSNVYALYNKTSLAEINPVEVNPYFEDFLQQKLLKSPNNPLYTILLYDTYINDHKSEKAYNVIKSLSDKYPNSSLLNYKLIGYFTDIEDNAKAEELEKNIIQNDEDYYFSVITKIGDQNWLQEANISELEKYREKSKKLQSDLYTILFDVMINLRKADVDNGIKKMDELIDRSYHNEMFITLFAPLYTSLKNDRNKTISILEELLLTKENETAQNLLISNYISLGRKDDAQKLVQERIKHYPYYNYVYNSAITYANNESKYEDVVKYADIGLKNFPYSFELMESKGKGYNSLKKTDEAEKLFRESLSHNSANSSLRKILYDIKKVPDEIDQVATKNIYNIIKQRRNSKMECPYGVNVLLDEYICSIFPEGGKKTKAVYLYEVIAENGIEELKEYEVSGNNLNILKAEIVKPDGTIIPGDENSGTVVFTNLKVNDVIYLEYETTDNSYGRFYKDFTITYNFNGAYPSQQNICGIIYPDDIKFAFDIRNGDIPSKVKKVNNRNFMSWEKKNIPSIPLYEDYAPVYADLQNQIKISSIKSWSDISNWYSDLVKKSMKLDNVALIAYNEVFPKGNSGMSQEEIAYKIYKYIGENITYSSLDFRQSGYVPQTPSKTISTKLGDCKDVSTLFVTMAVKAGLKANLVLVQTNDKGKEALKLPSISFNHCIVKVVIDNKDYFLELTDNFLPFKALPSNLYKAKALVISFDKSENEKSGLISIAFDNTLKNTVATSSIVTVNDTQKKFAVTSIFSASNKSYYSELFSNYTTDEVRRKELEENIHSALNKVIVLESTKLLENERFKEAIKFENSFSVSEKLQSVGSLKILEVPFTEKIYTRDIISKDVRNYEINYSSYEHVDDYISEIILNIPEGKKFIEIPQNKELFYKGHNFKITYELITPASLKVTRIVKTPWDNIKITDYTSFKKYVEDVITSEEEIIGFK